MNVIQTARFSPATELFETLASLTWQRLPSTVRVAATRCLIDAVGCGLFGAQFPWSKITADFTEAEGANGNASVFGRTKTSSPVRAALCNGIAIHGFELDDIILGTLSHPGTAVVPAALALAEEIGATPDNLLLGITCGYETLARIGVILAPVRDTSFHLTGVMGGVSAAVAAAVTARLPPGKLIDAVGIACSRASGIKSFAQPIGGMVKRLHGGTAAETGVLSCLLAERGFTGPLHAVDGRFGLLEAIGGASVSAEPLSRDLGKNWAIGRVWTKMYPCCGALHTAVQAIERLRDVEKIEPRAVRKIRVGTSRRAVIQNGETAPRDTMGAQYSLPFCAALALVGDAKAPASFADAAITDPAVLAAIPLIEPYIDSEIDAAYPGRLGANVQIETADGRRSELKLLDAHGMPDDPCSDQEIYQKFRRLCGTQKSTRAVDCLLNKLGEFRDAGSVPHVSSALRALAS